MKSDGDRRKVKGFQVPDLDLVVAAGGEYGSSVVSPGGAENGFVVRYLSHSGTADSGGVVAVDPPASYEVVP